MTLARIGAAFSRHLSSYKAEAQAQRRIARTLFEDLRPFVPPCPRILEAGHGSGFLTSGLITLAPRVFWLNDLAAPLPDLAWTAPPARLAGDIAQLALPQRLDLIASSSMLQWIPNPESLIQGFCGALAPGGILAISSFGPENFAELAALGLPPGASSYRRGAALAAALPAEMELLAARDDAIPVHFPTAQALFAHLRATGVNGLLGGRLRPAALKALMARMNREGDLTLTYRPSYCLARKSGQTGVTRKQV
ncbi:methyltransferase domain-containing protein [Paracoccus sp. PAR01]|uniref:methyltransferase domain-containing protein n=1 Tax=Paracoccus sp. PAR01 TaxID=2769282 RepID=UPI001785CFFD|nr:methyltransferase domain-containing protein [Paracoccus sp. PAR01]MBD9528717.1 methyltransferase domain-containing protein [Paracoccus sp. PAR01]